MSIRALSLALVSLTALCACGLRGPLYLPSDKLPADSEQATQGNGSGKPRRPGPAPQSQKRESDDESQSQAPAQSAAPPDPDRPANVPIVPPGN